jgi:hypothetical protein
MERKSIADVEGPWTDPHTETGLVARCKQHWSTPACDLSNQMIATYLRQKIAIGLMLAEARRRLEGGIEDGSELYDGELAAAVQDISRADN